MKQSLHAFSLKYLHRKLGLPRATTYQFIRRVNRCFPAAAENIISRRNTTVDVSQFENNGYQFLRADAVTSMDKLLVSCAALYEEKVSQLSEDYFIKNPKKRFLLTIDSDESLLEKPYIREFISNDYILDTVHAYLKCPFVLSSLRLWWTPVNDSALSSQLYHLDEEDTSQVKLLINISDVSHKNGPFTFLTAAQSESVLNGYAKAKRRYTDPEIAQVLGEYQHESILGSAGTAGFVDTSRCLHYGSRNNTEDRLVLMAQFLKQDAPFLPKSLPLL